MGWSIRGSVVALAMLWPLIQLAVAEAASAPDRRDEYAAAVRDLRPLAEQGDAASQYALGRMYADGRGVPQDDAQAVSWFRQAAEQGHAAAQYNLGVMYAKGHGVPQDDAEAVSWYRKAAEQGDAAAQYRLGVMYSNGEGIARDDVRGYAWVDIAAARGNEEARNYLNILAISMTPAQVETACNLSRELWKSYDSK